MKLPNRDFVAVDAVRANVPLWFGVFGAQGGGKTPSAIRVGIGMQQVYGGDVHVIDTEGRRALAYAETYKFKHMPFDPPHGSLDFAVAIKKSYEQGARVIIVDSMSSEHSGIGGFLDLHDTVAEERAAKWNSTPDKQSMGAWAVAKANRKYLIEMIRGMADRAAFVLCFRASEKTKPGEGGKVIQLGFMPDTDTKNGAFMYELTASALLLPRAMGVPTWTSEVPGERMMIRLPSFFESIFATKGEQLNEEHGRRMAEWMKGSGMGKVSPKLSLAERADAAAVALKVAPDLAKLEARWKKCAPVLAELEAAGLGKPLDVLTATYTEQQRQLKENA